MAFSSTGVYARMVEQRDEVVVSPGRTLVLRNDKYSHGVTNSTSTPVIVVPVIYYLSRNGQLEHPHFMEVPLSSSHQLYLRDVINRLNVLRGKGMANLYSWSCKRSYKNRFVWHDLLEYDFIYPAHGNNEYVLKGSELVETTAASPAPENIINLQEYRADRRRRNQSCSSIDEYSVYKDESSGNSASADASTQTDGEKRHRRQRNSSEKAPKCGGEEMEISPPASDSSPETLETLMNADKKQISGAVLNQSSHVKDKASSVLMQLLTCGSTSFRECGTGQGIGLLRLSNSRVKVKVEEKEYFSGSIVETKKKEFPILKRSTSYGEQRSMPANHAEGRQAKCIRRRPKTEFSTQKQDSLQLQL